MFLIGDGFGFVFYLQFFTMWRGIPKQTPLPFLRSMTKIRLPRMRSTALHGRFPIRLLAEPAIPLYTNRDSETFPIGTVKELYRLRWGIETSFRELKYTIGLSCLHGKKMDFLLQEVFARLILYNYASLIARKIPVPQEKQINFSVAILVCKQFLKGKIRPAQIFGILSKHLSPIRPGRQYKRYQNPVSAVAFQYRFS